MFVLYRRGVKLVREITPGTPPDHKKGPEDLYKLLDQPNDFMDYHELVALLVIDLLLVGNGYWYISENKKDKETGTHSCTARLYRWTGDAKSPFAIVK